MPNDKDDLEKFQPTPTFPGVGLPDDRKETLIVNTPEELHTRALASADARSRLAPKFSSLSEDRQKELKDSAVNEAKSKLGITVSSPGSNVSYSKGNELREGHSSGRTGPNAPQATKLHEEFHMMMNRVEGQFGRNGRKNFAHNLYHAIPIQFRSAIDSFHKFNAPSSFGKNPEEALALMHNYLNDGTHREHFFKQSKYNPEQARTFDIKMKRAHKMLRVASEVATSDWSMTKSEETLKGITNIASVAVFDKSGKLLFGKRNDSGRWTLPGGHFNPGETGREAAFRELEEETGFKVDELEFLGEDTVRNSLHIFCYKTTLDQTEPKTNPDNDPDEECQNWEWVDVSSGLPDKIANNLHASKNITLRLLELQKDKNVEELLDKSLKGKFLALATAVTLPFSLGNEEPQKPAQELAMEPVSVVGKMPPKKWTPEGLHHELHPIAHLESSFGQNVRHLPSTKGKFDTAFGALGFKPRTAHEEYLKQPHLQLLFPGLHESSKFLDEFTSEPTFYNAVANSHWNRIKRSTGNKPEVAAFAWRWGLSAAHNADNNKIKSDPYVGGFKKLLAKNPSKVFVAKCEKDIEEWLSKGETIKSLKNWHSKDGITIPAAFSPERAVYDQNFFDALDRNYGSGAKARLRPVKVALKDVSGSNRPVNKDRYSLYRRMLRAGDKVPPIVVVRSGQGFNVIDGNHRLNAAQDSKIEHLDAFEIIRPKVKK